MTVLLVLEQPIPGVTGTSLGLQPTGPFMHRSLRVYWYSGTELGGGPIGHVGNVRGSRGSSPVFCLCFPCMRIARHWSRSASLAPRVTAHHVGVR